MISSALSDQIQHDSILRRRRTAMGACRDATQHARAATHKGGYDRAASTSMKGDKRRNRPVATNSLSVCLADKVPDKTPGRPWGSRHTPGPRRTCSLWSVSRLAMASNMRRDGVLGAIPQQ